ncbi:dihydroneopterin aldolase [uncultured Duncaniella sp.]|uniref:dihydroneopterin aldolase n=1 Tax=uncultured Duncaniella sp. TaxID=2768039 RepID=UPI0025DE7E34|nr:dihydroneopterin aldolase [uncultured Duncaniella sp.]
MKGIIEINGLRLFARHGVFEEERINGNTFELTVHLCYPIDRAVMTDNVADTLNYAEAIEIIRKEMEIPSRLLEHVVGRIRSALLSAYPAITSGSIKLTKLNPPIPVDIDGTAVKIEW